MKIGSIFSIIRETQIKTTILADKNSDNTMWMKVRETDALTHCWLECEVAPTLWRTIWQCLSKTKTCTLAGTISCVPGIIPPLSLLTVAQVATCQTLKQWVYLLIHLYLLSIYCVVRTVRGSKDTAVKEEDQTLVFMISLCQRIEIPEQNGTWSILIYGSNNRWPYNFH